MLASWWKAEPTLQARACALWPLAWQASWALLATSAVPQQDCAWRAVPALVLGVQALWAPWAVPGQGNAWQARVWRSAGTALMRSPAASSTPLTQEEMPWWQFTQVSSQQI